MTHAPVESRAHADEAALVTRLREGDEQAFAEIVDTLYPAMLAVARGYVRTRALAEDVVQEAWLGVLKGLDRFEGRSSFRTWALTIVANIARTRAVRDARSVPFSAFESDEGGPSVEPERFRGPDDPYPGHWRSYPTDWRTLPERRLLAEETLGVVRAAIEELPASQRAVITLRDVTGCTSAEVCAALGLTEGNQRVLLHRARTKVRARLEEHLDA